MPAENDAEQRGLTAPLVRSPWPHEASDCRALLPAAFPAIGEAAELLIVPGPTGIRAAAAMAWSPGSFPILVHVLPRWRRQGLGSLLVDRLIRMALGETRAVRTWGSVEEGGEDASFLLALGFRVTRRLLNFESDNLYFEKNMTGLLTKIRSAGRISPDMKLVSLGEAPAGPVMKLVAPHLDAMPHEVAARMSRGSAYQYDSRLSLVVLDATRVVAAMLCRFAGGILEVDVRVVDPDYRRSLANLLLLEGMARNFRVSGAKRCRFSCEPHNSDTINLARRCGALALPTQLVLSKALV